MIEKTSYAAGETIRAYECSGCGQCFESMDRLRQHEIDCKEDDFE
jgi:hypothetical protein